MDSVHVPYFSLPSIPLPGPLDIEPFGLLVAIGVITGIVMARRKAASLGVDEDTFSSFAGWVIITGFLGAHFFQLLFYERVLAEPQKLLDDPLMIARVWDGISSYGGIFGAIVGFWIFTASRGVSRLRWGDIGAHGIVPGWLFGRAGCAIVNDHPGEKSDFFLAVDFPENAAYVVQTLNLDPGPRHDLGLYEFLYWIFIAIVLYAATRRPRPAGFAIALVALLYAPVRFMLEFLRLELLDPPIWGFTPAQYASVVIFAIGLLLMWAAYRYRREELSALPTARDASAAQPSRARGGGGRGGGPKKGAKKR